MTRCAELLAAVLKIGPFFLFGLVILDAAVSRPYLELTDICVFYFFVAGTAMYLLTFGLVAIFQGSFDLAFRQLLPSPRVKKFGFVHVLVLVIFSLLWGANVGVVADLATGLGPMHASRLVGNFIRYHHFTRTNCAMDAIFSSSFGEIDLCVDEYPSKIHPRIPIASHLNPGESVVLEGEDNGFFFFPQKVSRNLTALH